MPSFPHHSTLLPIQTRSLSVKNTFIVDDDEEEHRDIEIHQCGARTCVARLADNVPSTARFGTIPAIQRIAYSEEERSDIGLVEQTPTGSENDFSTFRLSTGEGVVESHGAVGSFYSAASLARESICLASSLPADPRRTLRREDTIQVPMDLRLDDDCPVGRMDASEKESGSVMADVRLVLPSVAIAPIVCVNPIWAIGVSALPKTTLAGTSLADSGKAVCCHWKNKGWCKYQQYCKFLHPEHKRGVGSVKNSFATCLAPKQGLRRA